MIKFELGKVPMTAADIVLIFIGSLIVAFLTFLDKRDSKKK